MQTFPTIFHPDLARHGLKSELRDLDDRQLLDIGLVRSEDGALWLAEDPAHQVSPPLLQRQLSAILAGLAGALRQVFGGQNRRPHLSRREPV